MSLLAIQLAVVFPELQKLLENTLAWKTDISNVQAPHCCMLYYKLIIIYYRQTSRMSMGKRLKIYHTQENIQLMRITDYLASLVSGIQNFRPPFLAERPNQSSWFYTIWYISCCINSYMHNTQTQGNKMLKQKSKAAEGDYSYGKEWPGVPGSLLKGAAYKALAISNSGLVQCTAADDNQ